MKVQEILRQRARLIGFVLLMTAGISDAYAQNMSPLTGKLLQEPVAAPTNASTMAATPAQSSEQQTSTTSETRVRVGDVTHTLLQAQADGRVAGPRLPMLGVTADASWQRYLDSFRHPLPEFFQNKVSRSSSN